MTDRLTYHMRPNGLGIIIIELSVLLATGRPINAAVPNQNHMLYDFKRIFNIGDDRLIITHDPDSVNDRASDDLMKTFVPYFTTDTVTLFGQSYPVGARNKPCIGLAMHHAGGSIGNANTDPLGETKSVKDFPYNKFATYQVYSKIIKLVTDAGYDVVTLNSPKITVEHKAFLINNLCDCVIGYEGGAMQLAHTLKVPCVILPWNSWIDGETQWRDGTPWDPDRIESHKYHVDRRTWFLKTPEEILAWNPGQLKSTVENLYANQGNNFLFEHDVVLDPQTLQVNITTEKNVLSTLPEATRDFIHTHIANPTLG